jgi:hypothetical protein
VCSFRAALSLLVLVFSAALGCGKKDAALSLSQPSAPSEHRPATPTTGGAPAIATPPDSSQGVTVSELSGEVTKGHGFEKPVVGGLIFRLAPDAGSDSGWEIHLAPAAEPSLASIDCVGAVSEPVHGDDHLSIEPPGLDKEGNEAQWKKREFDFVPNPEDCKKAWDLGNEAHYPSKLTDKQREEADAKLGKILTSHGVFQITDFRLSKSASKGALAQIEWLKFAIRLEFPPRTDARSAPTENSKRPRQGIHDVDVERFVKTHYNELDPNLESLQEECGEGQAYIRSVEIQYGDVDGDGQEEALFQGYTCLAGTSGVDYSGIVKLQPDGKLVGLPIAPVYPVYKGDECEACSSGGQRKFVFRWNGHEFVLDDIINVPPDRAGN